jgi:replication-associated recombination protein RarA
VIGNKADITSHDNFFKSFSQKIEKSTNQGVIVCGPPGVDKFTRVHLICYLNGYRPIEFNASDYCLEKFQKENINSSFVNEGLTVDISTERTCLIFDEID